MSTGIKKMNPIQGHMISVLSVWLDIMIPSNGTTYYKCVPILEVRTTHNDTKIQHQELICATGEIFSCDFDEWQQKNHNELSALYWICIIF